MSIRGFKSNPEFTAANDARHLGVMWGGPLLGAHLNDSVMATRRFDHRPSVLNIMGEWFFHINVLPRLAGEHRGNGVPVVGRGDEHGVDVLSFEQPAKIFVCYRGGSGPLLGPGQMRRIQIAHGHEFEIGHVAHQLRVEHAAPAATDKPEAHPLVRAEHLFRGKGGGRHNRAGLYDSFDELSSFHANGSPLSSSRHEWKLFFPRYAVPNARNSASHGLRYGRTSIFAASASPMISSFSASQRILRPVRNEMFARWQTVATRWPLSRSELGSCRDFMQSRKLRTCSTYWSFQSPEVSLAASAQNFSPLSPGTGCGPPTGWPPMMRATMLIGSSFLSGEISKPSRPRTIVPLFP